MMQPTNGAISENNKPRIEIKSLCQEVCKDSDQILQALMNDEGWQVMGTPGYTSVTVPNVSAPGWRIKHYEIIKLWRQVEQQPSEPIKAATNYSSTVERISTARETVICGMDGGPPPMRKPLDEVTFLEALASGQYSAEEISAIGDGEALENVRRRVIGKRQTYKSESAGVKFCAPPTSKRTTPLLQQ